MSTTRIGRRQTLQGLGVTLGLPFLESLAPRTASAQSATGEVRKRWIVMYFANGTPNFDGWWKPSGQGAGAAWKLSSLLEPLAKHKSKTTVLTGLENYSVFGSNARAAEPSHSQLAGAFLTCNKCATSPSEARNAISADQVLAKSWKTGTPFESLQVGLTTKYGDPDGRHPANSRSVSWASATEPLYKTVNPQALFDSLTGSVSGGGPSGTPDPLAERRRLLRKSALDYVRESATSLKGKVGVSDRARLDQYLTSMRDLEKRVEAFTPTMSGTGGTGTVAACSFPARSPFAAGAGLAPSGYNRGVHADLVIDLSAKAIECDLTRVISFMLDDERSEYGYAFLPLRNFTATGSTLAGGATGGSYHDLQHSGDSNPGYATITHWNVQKLAQLCDRLQAIDEGGKSALDNSVVHFGSCMHGGDHAGNMIPTLYVGSGGGVLKTDQHVVFPNDQRVADVYLTYLQKVFGQNVPSFGNSRGILSQLLA